MYVSKNYRADTHCLYATQTVMTCMRRSLIFFNICLSCIVMTNFESATVSKIYIDSPSSYAMFSEVALVRAFVQLQMFTCMQNALDRVVS